MKRRSGPDNPCRFANWFVAGTVPAELPLVLTLVSVKNWRTDPQLGIGIVRTTALSGIENILRYIKGEPLASQFDGHANCFIESGYGKAFLLDFNYDLQPVEGKYPLPLIGPFSLLRETRLNHFGKLAFKWIYWNLLLRGTPMPGIGHDEECNRRNIALSL